jgi:delta8-fatty-acid desaturase
MMNYKIGRIDDCWINLVPPIQHNICEATSDKEPGKDLEEKKSKSSRSELRREQSVVESLQQCQNNSISHSQIAQDNSSLEPQKSSSGEGGEIPAFLDLRSKREIDIDLDKYPALDPATQEDITIKYRQMAKAIEAEGIYQCKATPYVFESLRCCILFGIMLYTLGKGWHIIAGLSLGIFWQQVVFIAHDAGHMAITHDYFIDTALGVFIASVLGGVSLTWWKVNHNIHHIVTNSPEHDPDIQHLPFIATSHRFFGSLTSSFYKRVMRFNTFSRVVLPHQSFLYYPMLCFGRFNLYVLSWTHILSAKGPNEGPARWIRLAEALGQIFYWIWYGYYIVYRSIPTNLARFIFVLVSHAATLPLHVQFTLGHFAMSTADLGPQESFPQKMLRTTMDLDCPAWLDFVHGGLQFQVIHHLFPRIPRHNLRRAQNFVLQFCEETSIPYALLGFVKANEVVLSRLEEIGQQAAIFNKIQRSVTTMS